MGSDQKRAFLAIIFSAIILFVWQSYFAPKQLVQPPAQQVSEKAAPAPVPAETITPVAENFATETITLSSNGSTLAVRNDLSFGAGISPGEKYDFLTITGNEFPLKIQILNSNNTYQVLNLKVTEKGSNRLSGIVENLNIKFSMVFQENGRLTVNLNSSVPYKYRLAFKSKKDELEDRRQREYIYLTQDVEREAVEDEFRAEGNIKWVGIDHKFHIFNFIFAQKSFATVTGDKLGNFYVDIIKPTNVLTGDVIFAKKNYDTLTALGDNLNLSVDFGFFGVVAVPIFRGMQFFYSWIPNYGWAIILLTLLIRTITFPLQYKSFKSMKKMQVIQPEIAKIKEKYKEDPQRMQKETMELFKRAGANPLGGCLPLLIQMPVFFAFYKVLYEAVELVGAPWIFWVTDLSQKDPLYILPVLMAISMFLQQKFTPTTTTDPMQKKLMMFMPLIFGFIMKDLPSGLTLYIFVSTIFGILQQMFVYKTTD